MNLSFYLASKIYTGVVKNVITWTDFDQIFTRRYKMSISGLQLIVVIVIIRLFNYELIGAFLTLGVLT